MDVAGAVIGVAASVITLIEALKKLERVCGRLRKAPEELSDLVSEVSIIAKQLEGSKRYFNKTTPLDADLVSKCVHRVDQAFLAVEALINEIETTSRRYRAIGSVEYVLKSRHIQELKKKLTEAQQHLDRTERIIDRAERERAR